jgi:hypothetical protein
MYFQCCGNLNDIYHHTVSNLTMTESLPSMQWGCIGSLDMLGYEVMRLPTSSQGTVLFCSLLDLSRPWEFLGRIYEEGLDAGWLTSIGYGGEVLVTPKGRLET